MKYSKLNQSGAVSMLSVLVFSIIITVVATAYIKSVTSQQKTALNYDLGTRAYYAAESGVQDAIRSLAGSTEYQANGKPDCAPADGGGALGDSSVDYGIGYTCQIIKVTPTDVKGRVEPNAKNAMARLEATTNPAGPYKLVVRWSQKQTGTDQVYYPRSLDQPLFPPYNQWNASGDLTKPVHALLKVNVISVPKTGTFTRDQIQQRVVFMNPTTPENAGEDSGGGFVDFKVNNEPLGKTSNGAIEPQRVELMNNAECYPSDNITGSNFKEYSCKSIIRLQDGYDLTTQTLYARVSSIYRSTDFSIELTQDNDTPLTLKNGQAVIDVTGKAGSNVFRRVQQTVSLGGYFEDDQPDAALIAGEGICKLLSYTTVAAGYQEGCDPLAANN
jgi:hypothetical protein